MSKVEKPGFCYGYVIVLAGFIIMFATWGTFYSFGIFLKPLLTEFGWTRAMTSGAFSLSNVVRGLLGIVMGALTDRFGPRLVMVVCGLFLGAGYLLMSQVGSTWQLYLFYGVMVGIGMGGSWVPVLSTVARWFVAKRGMMSGIVLTGMGISILVMPPLARWLVTEYGWQTSYMVIGFMALVLIVLSALFLRRHPVKTESQIDTRGESGVGNGGQSKGLSLQKAIYFRQLWIVFGMLFCYGYVIGSVMVHMVPHATDIGISATDAANILAIIGGVSIISKLILGSIASRIGGKSGYFIVFFVGAISMFWLMSAREMWMLYLFVVLFGFVYGGDAIETVLVAELFGLKSLGIIMSTAGVGFTIGFALGPFVAGYIFDYTGNYQMAFLTGTLACIAGAVLISSLRVVSEKGGRDESRRGA